MDSEILGKLNDLFHSLTPLVVFHKVAATSVLGFRDSDAAAFAAVHDNGDEFDFLSGTESLGVLFVVHGWGCVSDGHVDGLFRDG